MANWQAVHNDYRAGALSIRALAAKHGVSEGGIRYRARTEGWQRDLSEHVKHATACKLLRSESTHLDAALPADDATIVSNAASENVALILEHRQAIARWRAISNRLADALERQAFNLDAKGQGDEGQTFEQLMKSVAPLTDDELDARILVLSAKVNDQTP